ncbi:hypothetical protein HZS_1160 [Henneguya salminicola]|nr:hypothetical protein HZS_1160 [Henneguya salminicola]
MTPVPPFIWIKKVYGNLSFSPPILLWDVFRSHLTTYDRICIPGGYTKYLKSADVLWNTSRKKKRFGPFWKSKSSNVGINKTSLVRGL